MESKTSKRKSGMVKLRGGFSDQYGIIEFNKIQQTDEFDDDTRTRIRNRLRFLLEEILTTQKDKYHVHSNDSKAEIGLLLYNDLCNDVFCSTNTLQAGFAWDWHRNIPEIEAVIEQATYNEVLDLIQYLCQWISERSDFNKNRMFNSFNELFEKEYVGYRFVAGYITPITDKRELAEIAEACNNPYEGAQSHMKKAVQFLANRETKDYKNCIKESISAVEAVCKVITNDESAVLSGALVALEKKKALHPTLKKAINHLYNYTCDEGGIRHAEGLFESNVTFDEAKYFLVSCSAFVNYLIAEHAKGAN